MVDSIVILDFGSQYTQLIARRVRELQVFSEIVAWDAPSAKVMAMHPRGIILSGGPSSVYDENAPFLPEYVLQAGVPVLGICYGLHVMTKALGGKVIPGGVREYGLAEIDVPSENPLLPAARQKVWMSHGDRVEQLPDGFKTLAVSSNGLLAGMACLEKNLYAVQFHPEVHHTERGKEILKNFVIHICGCQSDWTPQSIIDKSIQSIRAQVGDAKVISAVSGGVDSSVATALVQKAVGSQLSTIFIDTGLLREGEVQQVQTAFKEALGADLTTIDASQRYFTGLSGVTEPEKKRKIIGELFIRLFEEQAKRVGNPSFLVQGTIYPDVVESSGTAFGKAERIKSHHNVGGLPSDMKFALVEPLRELFKDEVRLIGEALGLPSSLVWRQPFPGPGLAVRCLGQITPERVACLRKADAIFTSELTRAGLLGLPTRENEQQLSQAFAVLLPVQSVGVMGDQRTYQETIALRAVTTEDFMTANWAVLPAELLARVSSRIVNEVAGVNRVVYDITSKPPATIEWE
jgi:GMP synthase (glutamine-hydrolysing)